VSVHPLVFDRVLDMAPSSGWQVVQEQDWLTVLLSGASETLAEETLAEAVQRVLAAQGVAPLTVRVQQVAAIPRGAGGKALLVKLNIPRNPAVGLGKEER
jgi:hypothetical protein